MINTKNKKGGRSIFQFYFNCQYYVLGKKLSVSFLFIVFYKKHRIMCISCVWLEVLDEKL